MQVLSENKQTDKQKNKKKTKKQKKRERESSHCGAAEIKPTNIHEDASLIPGPAQWVNNPALT